MRQLNWFSHKLILEDGYGRMALHLIRTLCNLGIDVHPQLVEMLDTPGWCQRLAGINTGWLNLSFMPAHELRNLPGRQWAFSMVESTLPPYEFVERINSACERLIVPCQANVDAFKKGGVRVDISVVPGGIDPAEFPLLPDVQHSNRPYTFLCLGDRGERKGMMEVIQAFYTTFPTEQDVRLVIKARPHMLPGLFNGSHNDRRISFWLEDVDSMRGVYEQVDCFVFPSYFEGYGLPPREAACMGLPVIASRHSGLDDGNLDCWAIPLEDFTESKARTLSVLTLPDDAMWYRPSVKEVGAKMRWCYEHQDAARAKGRAAAQWLRENQTWTHAAKTLVELIERWA